MNTDLPYQLLFPSAAVLFILSLIGLYGNACIIWATFKFKNFHQPCGILIGLLAVGDFGHQLNHLPYSALIFSGATFISQRTCFWIQLFPAICMQHSVVLLAVLGIDRLICVTKPLTYRNISSSKLSQFYYILLLNALPCLYIGSLVAVSYSEMVKQPNQETLCLIVAFFAGEAQQYWSISATFFTTLAVLIYSLLWIIVKIKTSALSSVKSTLKPLTIILVMTFFGWCLGMTMVFYISKRIDLSRNLQVGWISYAGIFINLTISVNYFVYRFFATDYKKAFNKLWKVKISPISSLTS